MKTMILVAAMLLVLLALSMGKASAQTALRPADEPPVANFTKTVSPTLAVAGDVVRYTLQFTNPAAAGYTATVVMSDTLHPRLAVIANSRTAQRSDGAPIGDFIDPPAGVQAVSWSAEIVPGDEITITFDVTVTGGVTAAEVVTNVAKLYAIEAATATLTATASLLQEPFILRLPLAARSLEPFPALSNGDFELGPGTGWTATPSTIIFAYANIYLLDPTFTPPDGNRANLYLVWLGGVVNRTRTLSQSVLLPPGYTNASLRYKYWIGSEENTCDQDTAALTISTHASTPPLVYPILLCEAQNTFLPGQAGGWRDNQIDLSGLLAQAGSATAATPLTITFQGIFNGSLTSNLWLEDVELCTDQPGAPGAPRCTTLVGGR